MNTMPQPQDFPFRHLLQILYWHGGFEMFKRFLLAFPKLQKMILVIHDHLKYPYRPDILPYLTNAPAISIWDYDKLVRQGSPRPQPCVKVFSYAFIEGKHNTEEFNESRNCLYVRHMDKNSLICVYNLSGRIAPSNPAMIRHIIRVGAWFPLARFFSCRRYEQPIPSWFNLDGKIDRKINPRGMKWFSNTLNPPLTRSYWGFLLKAPFLRRLTTLHTTNYSHLDLSEVSLPRVKKAIISLNSESGGRSHCPLFQCRLPRVKNLYVEYYGCTTPHLGYTKGPWAIGQRNGKKATFTLVNTSWSPQSPCSPHDSECKHSASEIKSAKHWYRGFLENFRFITLKGIPDEFLQKSRLRNMRELYWERVCPEEANGIRVYTPRLKKLSLCSLVKREWPETPCFDCPKLKWLKLVSLVGSDDIWDLPMLFMDYMPRSLTHLEFNGFWWLRDDEEPMSMTSDRLSFVAKKLERLSVKGYRPDFVLSKGNEDVGPKQQYTKLKDLTIDVTRIPLCSGVVFSSEPDVLMVDFCNPYFPVLETVSLVVPYGGSTGVLPQAKKISLFVSPGVKTVQMSSTLFNGRVVEINGVVIEGQSEGVPETNRTGRLCKRSKDGVFKFSGVVVLEEWEDCI